MSKNIVDLTQFVQDHIDRRVNHSPQRTASSSNKARLLLLITMATLASASVGALIAYALSQTEIKLLKQEIKHINQTIQRIDTEQSRRTPRVYKMPPQ